jgi:hypothetical protein
MTDKPTPRLHREGRLREINAQHAEERQLVEAAAKFALEEIERSYAAALAAWNEDKTP